MKLENMTFTTGLMGAGKSKALIEQHGNYTKNMKSPLVLTLSFNDKNLSFTRVTSRNSSSVSARAISISDQDFLTKNDIKRVLQFHQSILIDEAQFLSDKLLSIFFELSSEGFSIDFYGLSHTFTGELFEASRVLKNTLLSDSITILESTCEISGCTLPASYNARFVGGKIAKSGEILLEAKLTYKAVCSSHFN